jgi:hypothetical protein
LAIFRRAALPFDTTLNGIARMIKRFHLGLQKTVWDDVALSPVIPAQAGIQNSALRLHAQPSQLDPRLRGDDE